MESTLQEDLIGKYLSGELSPGEKGELMAWVDASSENREVFEEMTQLWSMTDEAPAFNFPVNLPNAWARLDQRIDTHTALDRVEPQSSPAKPMPQIGVQPKIRSLNRAWSVAAAIAVLLVASWWIFLRERTPDTFAISTQMNESRSITLPDESKVVLNENSSLSYHYAGDTREVILSGEAFFDVAKDPRHPFVIQSGDVETKVLGTSFNIRAYPDEEKVKVSVKTGRVEVSAVKISTKSKAVPVVLLSGNTVEYEAKTETLEKAQDVAAENVDSWQEGTLIFQPGTKLSEIIPAVEKMYDVKITTADVNILNVSIGDGVIFKRDFSLPVALELITLPIGGKSSFDGETYVISAMGRN